MNASVLSWWSILTFWLFSENKLRYSLYSHYSIDLPIVCHCLLHRYHLRFFWDFLSFLLLGKLINIYLLLLSLFFLSVVTTYLLSSSTICFTGKVFQLLLFSPFLTETLIIFWLKSYLCGSLKQWLFYKTIKIIF